jgi:hypothetical protein
MINQKAAEKIQLQVRGMLRDHSRQIVHLTARETTFEDVTHRRWQNFKQKRIQLPSSLDNRVLHNWNFYHNN